MSLEILIVGAAEKHQKLTDALKQGLHEVDIINFSEGLVLGKARDYSAIILCLDDNPFSQCAPFAQNLKKQHDLKHVALIAYFNKDTVQIADEIRHLPFDDVICPQQDSEYSSIAPKITAVYRRLQVLNTMRTRSELLEAECNDNALPNTDIALLLNPENTVSNQDFQSMQEYNLHFFDSITATEAHIEDHPSDILIIDASFGIEAMKLASRLSSNFGKHSPVLVLIPQDQPHILMQCIEIRVHDFIVLPVVTALLGFKISIMQRWVQEYNCYNSSVDQQLTLSVRDELTGLYNRRYLNRLLARMTEQAEHQLRKFSICIIDVDHFKKFNDTYGHAVGDTILRQLAYQMELRVRRHDNVGRWGGEEFIIIFADVTESLGAILADRIRDHIAEYNFTDSSIQQALNITISIGVAHCRPQETPEELINRADRALYQAKLAGRNCVIAAE